MPLFIKTQEERSGKRSGQDKKNMCSDYSRIGEIGNGSGFGIRQPCFPWPCVFIFPALYSSIFIHPQHTETFAFFLFEMLVMHFMRPAKRPDVVLLPRGKPFDTLVDDHFMHQGNN